MGNLGEARQLVTWLYRDAAVGKVSEVLDQEGDYVFAVMTGETEKGYKTFEKVKETITPMVRNEVKAKLIIEKLANQKGSLEEAAKLFGTDATIDSTPDLKINATSMRTVGFDPIAIGKAFSLEGGKRSAAFAGENGVLIIEMINKTIAPAIGDFSIYIMQTLQM